MDEESIELLPCVQCGSIGWTDHRKLTPDGYICARCARPDIDWAKIDSIEAKS